MIRLVESKHCGCRSAQPRGRDPRRSAPRELSHAITSTFRVSRAMTGLHGIHRRRLPLVLHGCGCPLRILIVLQTLPYRNRSFDRLSRLVAKGYVKSIWLVHVCAHERRETSDVRISLTRRPDRVHVRCDCDEFLQVRVERTVVHGSKQQADASGSPIGIAQDGKAREVDGAAAREIDVRLRRIVGQLLAGDVIADGSQHVSQTILLAAVVSGQGR